MSKSKIVLSGRFEVFPDGRINRIENGKRRPANVCFTGRNRNYAVVSYMLENGKQTKAYVHRLVAGAFIPNPDNLPHVNHKDGNTRNNRVDNLEWTTNKQSRQHSYETGLVNPMASAEPCIRCGSFTRAKDGICTWCKNEMKKDAYIIDHAADLRERFSCLAIEDMPELMQMYVRARANGMSVVSIAKKYGVSKQSVSLQLLKAENNYQRGVPK